MEKGRAADSDTEAIDGLALNQREHSFMVFLIQERARWEIKWSPFMHALLENAESRVLTWSRIGT